MKKIVLTGGGTAGHVTPNIALMPELKKRGYDISYIGSYEGMEKGMIMETKTPYYGIATGKLRRYFDLKNFTDPFRIIKGYFEARSRLKKIHPDVVFSKGGFVAVPVVRAAHALKIPVIIHESDMTPGLANSVSLLPPKFAAIFRRRLSICLPIRLFSPVLPSEVNSLKVTAAADFISVA